MSDSPNTSPEPAGQATIEPVRRTHWPRVWIIVLNYNGGAQLQDCVRSVMSLNYPNYWLLVVDNASTDDSIAQAQRLYPDVEILQTGANLGFGGGNNRGIARALAQGADYVWLLNNDAIADRSALTALVEFAETDKMLGAVGSVLYEMEARDKIQSWGGAHLYLWCGHVRNLYSADGKLSFVTGASLLLRCRALKEVGVFDERYFFLWEDADLCLRLREKRWRIGVAEQSWVLHQGGGTTSPQSSFRMEHHAAGLVLTLRKHGRLPWLSALPMLGYYAWIAVQRLSWAHFRHALVGWRRGWSL